MHPAKRFKGKQHQAKSTSNGSWQVTEVVPTRFNTEYLAEEFIKTAAEKWAAPETGEPVRVADTKCTIVKHPFNCCQLKDFFEDDSFLRQLKEELLELNFSEKNNDLYKFHQSRQDLKKVMSAAVSTLRKFLYSDFRQWLTKVTGIQLNNTVDMSCAQYHHTDVLLCHDDELDGRRIAYILYLVDEDWSSSDGGNLDLFDVDENNQPRCVAASVTPAWNSFGFFAVTTKSFHQVSEVLSENKCRLSVVGWFHGEPIERPPPYIEPLKHLIKPGDMDEDDFYSWINPVYLEPNTQGDVQETFGEKSEIQLQEFINPDKYTELCRALVELDAWRSQGPANKRHYETTENESGILEEARKFFASEAFFLVLSNLTGLKLHRLAATPSSSDNDSDSDDQKASKPEPKKSKEVDPCCKLQISRWKAGSYTMLSDEETDGFEHALDVWFFLSAEHWQLEHGGQVCYIARGEDEELLTICPSNNCLALVYRDLETMRFVKHINSLSGDLKHFTINGVYYDAIPSLTC